MYRPDDGDTETAVDDSVYLYNDRDPDRPKEPPPPTQPPSTGGGGSGNLEEGEIEGEEVGPPLEGEGEYVDDDGGAPTFVDHEEGEYGNIDHDGGVGLELGNDDVDENDQPPPPPAVEIIDLNTADPNTTPNIPTKHPHYSSSEQKLQAYLDGSYKTSSAGGPTTQILEI